VEVSNITNMASKGKKGKKPKGVALSLNDFLANGGGGGGAYRAPGAGGSGETTTVEVSNWADEMDEYDDRPKQTVVLPTAPRAALGVQEDVEKRISHDPPFTAYIANLPYDVDEQAVEEVFRNARLKIKDVRLMKEEGGRLRGYGYADFEDRQSLIDVLTMTDLAVNNRKIRIDLATSAGKDGKSGFGGGGGGFGDREGRGGREEDPDAGRSEVDCWRSGPPPPTREVRGGRDGGDRDRRGGFGDRDRDRDGGSRGFGNYEPARGYGGDRDRDRDGGRGYGFGGDRDSRGSSSRYGDRDSRDSRDSEPPKERPRLALAPRSKPAESAEAGPTGASSSIFGGAKPVDTLKKEKELEEKMAQEKEARLKRAEEARTNKPSAASIFGGAKPVDTTAREREIEQKLSKLTVADDRERRDKSREGSNEGDREKKFEAAPAPIDNAWRRKPDVKADEPEKAGVYRPPRRDAQRDDRDGGRRDEYRRDDRDGGGRRDDYRRDDRAPRDYGRDDRRGDRDGPRRDDGYRRDDRRDDRDYGRRDDGYRRDDRGDDRRSAGRDDRDDGRRDDRKSPVQNKAPVKAKSPPPMKQYEEPKAPEMVAPNKFAALLDEDDAGSPSEED